jgi:glucose/arabinose dehydrogenase
VLPAGFCAFEIPVSIDRARSVLSLPGGSDLLALERGTQSVVIMEDTDGDGVPDSKRTVAQADSLNHGMALFDGYLYASSDTTVYRWPWDETTKSVVGPPTIVINNINADGNGGAPQGHTTRTLEFDSEGRLYVSVGSNDNVDPDSFRSRIRRFNIVSNTINAPSSAPSGNLQPSMSASSTSSSRYNISVMPFSSPWESNAPSTTAVPSFEPSGSSEPSSAPSSSTRPSLSSLPSLEPSLSAEPSAAPTPQVFPLDFLSGEVFADGIRNGVAMAHDKHGVLWAADTGADNLQRQDLGGDITNDNPAEELLKLPEDLMGTHFGYPYCWTEYRLDEPYALGRGTAWAWPATFNITVTDDDCRTKYGQASVAMQAHSTPLGITFYNYKPPGEIPDYCPGGAFPESMDGYVCK